MGMGVNEDVFQVLATSGNKPVAPGGRNIEQLENGQIGVFNYDTKKSVNKSTADIRNAVIMVGKGSGKSFDVRQSAGTHIQLHNVVAYTLQCYTAPKPMVVEFTDFIAMCDSDYGIKITFKNGQIYANHGTGGLTKSYVVTTGCCKECVACPSGDCIELAKLIKESINIDVDQLVTAEIFDPSSDTKVALTDEQLTEIQEANKEEDAVQKCVGIRITTNTEAVASYCGINLNYQSLRSTAITVSKIKFECSGKLETVQEMVYEEGSGYDLNQKAYKAAGFNGDLDSPYRQYAESGLAKPMPSGVAAGKYHQINLSYFQKSTTGFKEYENSQNTTIAIPCEDTTTLTSLIGVLDAIIKKNKPGFAGLEAHADKCNCDGDIIPEDNKVGEESADA